MNKPEIPFVDLKSQYHAVKDVVDGNIRTVLDHGMFILGPEVKECEKQLAQFAGAKHCVTAASGTDALLMALLAAGVGPGDEVITTPFTFIATVEVIVLIGARPVFVDIEKDTFNIDPKKIETAITERTKAIIPVSLYGQPADMDEINQLAEGKGIAVIEDGAQSFGAKYKEKRSCGLSEFGTTSFFPAKPLGCFGDGGAIFTDSDAVATKLVEVRDHGSERRYYHTHVGINGRMDTLQCAVILGKLSRYPWEIEQRQRVADRYNEAFSQLERNKISCPTVREDRSSVWAQYTLWVSSRDEFQSRLKELGVPTAIHYPVPVSSQPAYKKWAEEGAYPNADRASQGVISLPIFPDMTAEIQDAVIERVVKAAQGLG